MARADGAFALPCVLSHLAPSDRSTSVGPTGSLAGDEIGVASGKIIDRRIAQATGGAGERGSRNAYLSLSET
jgi:hypothetical protein